MRRPRGAVNLVNLTLTVALASAAYLAWLYVPLWLDDLDVREALAAAVGQLGSESGVVDVPNIRKEVLGRLNQIGYHWKTEDGQQVQVPGLGVDEDDLEIERSKDGRSARMTLEYGRTVKLKPLERYWTLRFTTTREGILRP